MNLQIIFVVFFGLITFTVSDEKKPGCFNHFTNEFIEIGQDYYPPPQNKECAKYTCKENNVVEKQTCPVINYLLRQGCKFVSDKNKQFPECCPRIVCKKQCEDVEII